MLGNQCPLKADSVVDYSDDYGFSPEADYETSEEAAKSEYSGSASPTKAKTTPTKSKAASKQGKVNDEEIMKTLKERSGISEDLPSRRADFRNNGLWIRKYVHVQSRSAALRIF